MDTTKIGRQAEDIAASWLTTNYGYRLIAKNWRTSTCEVDLIMQKADTIHFIEVKFRSTSFAGGGLESINKTKLARMYSAALNWLEQSQSGLNLNIAAIELSGKNSPTVTNFIDSISFDNQS
jgi:putative endonuclease